MTKFYNLNHDFHNEINDKYNNYENYDFQNECNASKSMSVQIFSPPYAIIPSFDH